MGLLSLGTPLEWKESRKLNQHVRESGIEQLKNIFKQHGARTQDPFLWGDEVEYMLVDVDSKAHTARLAIEKDYILEDLNDEEKALPECIAHNVSYHPEYGRFMVEATPDRPYDGNDLGDYIYVEENMKVRRQLMEKQLEDSPSIIPLTLTTFPRMGCGIFTSPPSKPNGPASQSLFLPDEIINRHVRFPTLTANIRRRKGRKVAINLPLYPDINTKLIDDSIPHRDMFDHDKEPFLGALLPGHVYMDSMGFGMGSSCLQVTMQALDLKQSLDLYDAMVPITGVLLALTAAAPIFKGFLVNQDVRWNVILGAVDDRTFYELDKEAFEGYDKFGGLDIDESQKTLGDEEGVKSLDGQPIRRVSKSRYDSVDAYLGGEKYYNELYNDIVSPINEKVYNQLVEEGLAKPLARHFAHLFIRDPLVIFNERINQDNTLENDHFENIQSTNWQLLRFKPPALYPRTTEISKTPGWRVEFRPMEIQITDFENAAFSVFIALLSGAIIKFAPNLLIPILKVDENMKTAHDVDAAISSKFWFRSNWNVANEDYKEYGLSWFSKHIGNERNGIENGNRVILNGNGKPSTSNASTEFSKFSVDEIINGNRQFPGLLRLVIKYVATTIDGPTADKQQLSRLHRYCQLISLRASGDIPTAARWLRNQVLESPVYENDSKVSEEINYDLIQKVTAITRLSDGHILNEFFGPELASYVAIL
ncbi:uncharacterized protein KQ657_003866 [Scheffersomyces spartinae]|uniref:Glutamate--cysteine ligase n=1 Tax=Scheffersomyces spartinae TaxID=45513 RepID=A0A9P7VC56_9ASCO|nr:uncharacterized protein KQ657_003866 [Scheffersomyces spartinae]KAG7195338.1 hypothetical protein KQ657_003866 [Scheffersomyces spartinae]